MRRPLLVVALVAALALLGVGLAVGLTQGGPNGGLSGAPTGVSLTLGKAAKPAPAFSARDLTGQTISLRRFAGRPLVVNFFASWCAPCKREAPGLAKLAHAYGRRVGMLGIALTSPRAKIEAFTHHFGWTWPIVDDSGLRLAQRFGVVGQPTTFVIAGDGRIATVFTGQTSRRRVAEALDRLLAA